MHIIHKKIPATVSSIQQVGQDSKEIFFTFEDKVDFSYYPGQFIMLEIPEPKEDTDWKIITPWEIWDAIVEKERLSQESLLVLFPSLEEKTLLGILHKLSASDHIQLDNGTYTANIDTPPERKSPLFQRAYSMASCPDGLGTVSTMVKATPNGFMSKYLTERLTVGEKVLISGPLGKFCFTTETAQNVLLISAGSGITPLMSILRYIHSAQLSHKATLLYSNKTPESIIYHQELSRLQSESDKSHITVINTITRLEESESEWSGEQGRIDQQKIEYALQNMDKDSLAVFICGPMLFGKSMKKLLILSGVSDDSIHMEAYG